MLETSWDELLWAAITVGRPNRQYVFRHGVASSYEALFRWSLVRMALEQAGPNARRLHRTSAARTLDPSEKGAISYFLGLAICKLFASKLLDTPWLLHLDVFRPMLNPVLMGRSRPDLVGQTTAGHWIVLECKGRVSPPNDTAKDKAKEQAERLVSVNGAVPTLKIGVIAYFRNEVLRFFWRDPASDSRIVRNPIAITVEANDWRHYYLPTLDLIRSRPDYLERMMQEPVLMPVDSADLEVGIHPAVLRLLIDSKWEEVRRLVATEGIEEMNLHYQPGGIAVVAGERWLEPFEEIDKRFGSERT